MLKTLKFSVDRWFVSLRRVDKDLRFFTTFRMTNPRKP